MGMCLNIGEQLMTTDAAKVITKSNEIDFIPSNKKDK